VPRWHAVALLYTRRGNDWAARMPRSPLARRAPGQQRDPRRRTVAVDARGRLVFYDLPAAQSAKPPARVKARLLYWAFDLLYLDGFNLRGAALIDRKRVLEVLL
jgi:bifunctional non-homologous end joining protein LigD